MRAARLVVLGIILLGVAPMVGYMLYALLDQFYSSLFAATGHHYVDCNVWRDVNEPTACGPGEYPLYMKPPLAVLSTMFVLAPSIAAAVIMWFGPAIDKAVDDDRRDRLRINDERTVTRLRISDQREKRRMW